MSSPIGNAVRRVRASRRRARRAGRRSTMLIIPVPEADEALGGWRDRFDPTATEGVPAHVTVLYPFVPADDIDASLRTDLAAEFAEVRPFPFRLAALGRFPGILYAAPEPAEPFVELTRRVWRRWPAWPPYDGAFADIVPHLTVAGPAEPAGLEDEVREVLPIAAVARQVVLLTESGEEGSPGWTAETRFDLGS